MGKAGDVAFCQRIEIDCPEHDRGGPGRRSRDCGLQYILAGHDYIDAAASKLAHHRRKAIRIIFLDEVNRQVAAFDIAQLAQPLFKGGVLGRRALESGDDADMEDAGRHLVRIRSSSGEADQKSRAKQPASGHSISPETVLSTELRFPPTLSRSDRTPYSRRASGNGKPNSNGIAIP